MKLMILTETASFTGGLEYAWAVLWRHVDACQSAILVPQSVPVVLAADMPLHQVAIMNVHEFPFGIDPWRGIVYVDHDAQVLN